MGVPGSANLLLLGGEQGYKIERSLRFNSADSAYLNRTPASAGNRKTYTISMWVKRAKLGATARLFGAYSTGSAYFEVAFTSSDTLQWYYWNGSGYSYNRVTTQVFRDPSAWCHLVFVFNSPSATASQRIRIYFNGQEITTFSSSTDPTQNFDCLWNSTSTNVIADLLYAGSPGSTFDGMMTEIHHIDGQALTPSSFGETDTITGVWKPKKYAGTYGTNGFYLNFSDNSGTTSTTLGKDSSGNSNNWTPNNFSVTAGAGNDSMIDTPTPYADGGNGRGNYCTLNPLARYTEYGSLTTTNGNLATSGGGTDLAQVLGSMGVRSGKWYFEGTLTTAYGVGASQIGIAPATFKLSGYASNNGPSITAASANGASYDGRGFLYLISSSPVFGATYTTGDVIGVAFDADTGKVWFAKNNTWQASGNPASGTSPATTLTTGDTWVPIFGGYQSGVWDANFGQRPFAYTPPSGFVALNTQNLPEPSIKKPSQYFDATAYTGTGATLSIVNSGAMQPDFVWFKRRSATEAHWLTDAVRGSTKGLFSNATDAETTRTDQLTAFNSNGFTLGADTAGYTNINGQTYIAWQWKESATPGFDIVTYTGNGTGGTTINHSLGVAPSMVIIKSRSVGTNWYVWHKGLTQPDYQIYLNLTDAQDTSVLTFLNDKAPTSTVFELPGAGFGSNNSSATYVAYLWSEVAGFSKFGSYTGNGSSDGPFVFCGFRPRWVMIKRTDSAGSWFMIDTARGSYNVVNPYVMANVSNAEATDLSWDILSNGFKLRSSYTDINTSSGTYVFAAFSESAFKYALAR